MMVETNFDIFAVLAHILGKTFIDFQLAGGQVLQGQHIGIADAEIVDGDGYSDPAKIVKNLHTAVETVQCRGFSQLNG
ncbi:Uncharacterised protein [Kluyvera cryocrescens]|uniref:Uncharacterized protein n=1 Tax=Kluyvera cryocrescens TaxID=580 RepID=A0A485A1P9_KLUCR|nr:Uncharacterised protein [Kluyvera cryocrescens]